MTNAGFYLLGKRAFHTLKYFCDHIGSASVGFVVCGTDAGVDDDFFDEIRGLCEDKSIQFFTRKQAESAELPHVSVRYAIGWRWVIRETHKLIILHDSLLPKFRGFCPLVNMLIEGEHEIGVTAIFASRDYDRGEIIDNRCVRINYPKKIKAAIELTIPMYQELVADSFSTLNDRGEIVSEPQIEAAATYSLWRDEKDYMIDWSLDAERISRFVDAVGPPFDGAKTRLNGLPIRISEVSLIEEVVVCDRRKNIGKTIFVLDGAPVVVCGSGLLRIERFEYLDECHKRAPLGFRLRFE